MPDTRVLTNQRVTVALGPETAVTDYNKPTLAQLRSLYNASESTKIDGLDFNVAESDQQDDRSLTDAAGSQARGFTQFGGTISFFTPTPTDKTSGYRLTRNIVERPRTKLAVLERFGPSNSKTIDPGDEINLFRTITDGHKFARGEVSIAYGVNFRPQDDAVINYVVPSAVAVAPVLTPTGAQAGKVGDIIFVKARYEGVNVTLGAKWISSNPAVSTVDNNGIVRHLSVGTATITATYPGAAAGTGIVYTVTAV